LTVADNWIQKAIGKKDEGRFSAKADRADMSTSEFASHVLANKDEYPEKTEKQANLARTLAKVRKHKKNRSN
tara:strand:+ start:6197 stop:6412 length:216 start_codon:yes stop_codon:yes gene_type:complete